MRAVIQRVSRASVDIIEAERTYRNAEIGCGLLILLAIETSDTLEDAQWLANKTAGLRIFEDDQSKMNLSLKETGGEALVVSQFTLYGNVRKGYRPSFNRSAKPDISILLYEKFCIFLEEQISKSVGRGVFGAMMNVELINDGPVTIIIDTKNKDL